MPDTNFEKFLSYNRKNAWRHGTCYAYKIKKCRCGGCSKAYKDKNRTDWEERRRKDLAEHTKRIIEVLEGMRKEMSPDWVEKKVLIGLGYNVALDEAIERIKGL